ncbi:tetratricopeptide repeat protein [Aliiroseovarius sp. PTFE2010]|uniref:tetratricopeptide repeat protein n=1 Tax=Aliiroseovarius sp. PTFE2010 TaxID=3417190 RepID=UPI003CF571FE
MPQRFALKSTIFAAALCAFALPGAAETPNPGAYLAARSAAIANDFEKSATYYAKALAFDSKNPALMEGAIAAQISLGKSSKAVAIARLLVDAAPDNQIANMVILSEAAKAENYDLILETIDADHGVGPLVDGLLGAWAAAGQGQVNDALARFDAVAESPGLKNFGLYHKALALILVGDFEGAAEIFDSGALPPTRRGIIAQAEVLSQLDRHDEAVELIDAIFGGQLDPGMQAMRDQLVAKEALPRSAVRSVQDGMAEVFFSVASALDGEADDAYSLLYARIAEELRPDHTDAHLQAAVFLERLGQYDLAVEAYRAVPRDAGAFYAAEQGRADALRRSGREDAAIEVLKQLAISHADIPAVHVTLGDSLRAQEKYDAAIESYDRAIEAYGEPEAPQWAVYFARAICHERMKNWDQAEADFRMALELQPDQPQVLNYLGYSYLEMQTNYEEALEMIEKAVQQRPNDGYITDSLGWGLYRVGRYDEAVVQMERAVELMAVDPVVNDHLGDVYWAVGRYREAEFQWRRALSFIDPEDSQNEADPDRIRRKLEVGLDKVLAEEGAAPLKVANGN